MIPPVILKAIGSGHRGVSREPRTGLWRGKIARGSHVIRSILDAWRSWRLARKRDRLIPQFRELDAKHAAARKRHARTRAIEAEKRRLLHGQLRREVAR